MGLNTRLIVTLATFVLLLWPYPALAHGGPPVESQSTLMAATQAQTTTLPYNFEPIEFDEETIQVLPTVDIPFVNSAISVALTLFSLLDSFSILGLFVVLLLAARVLWWVYKLVVRDPETETLNLSGALDTAADVLPDEQIASSARRGARVVRRNPFR